MRFSAILILFGLSCASYASDESISQKVVGTWQHDDHSGSSVLIFDDGSFMSSIARTNRIVALTYRGTWLVKDSELFMTVTNVIGTIPHERVGTVDRLRVIELDGHHLTFAYQSASNWITTNTFVKKP